MGLVIAGILMGIGGTLAMDVWAIALNRAVGQPLPNWGNVGRWAAHAKEGRVFHDSIGAARPVENEVATGWAVHYGVGVLYGIVFVLLAGRDWLADPTFLPLWLFSILTIAAGWFLMHPGMGLGWALDRTDAPWKGRIVGLLAHTAFAIGMLIVAAAVG